MPRSKIWLYVFILIAATLSIYARTAQYGFIGWDDDKDVLNKPRIQQLNIPSVVHLFNPLGIFQGQYYYEYFPVTDLTYMIEWHFYGKGFPQGFHIDNVLIHMINVLLIFVVISTLLLKATPRKAHNTLSQKDAGAVRGPPLLAAFLTALLFAVHPFMVENVSWLSGRKDLLLMMFYLLWFIFYMRSKSKQDSQKQKVNLRKLDSRWNLSRQRRDGNDREGIPQQSLHDRGYTTLWSILAFVCFILAILSKFQGVTIPGVLVAYELFINKNTIRNTTKKLILYLIVLLIYVPYTMWYYHKGATAFVDNYGLFWTIMFIPEAIFIYIRKLFLPFNLTPVYTVPSLYNIGLFIISLTCFILIILWVIMLLKQKNYLYPVRKSAESTGQDKKHVTNVRDQAAPEFSHGVYLFALSWFAANFIPVSNIVPLPTKIADRYMYEAALGVFLIAGIWMTDFYNRTAMKRITAVIYASIFILLAFLSYRQSLHWKDSYSLWSYTVALQPQSPVARNNLGAYYDAHDQPEPAKKEYELALKYDNSFVPALWNLGSKYLRHGDYEKAFPLIKRMSEIKAPEQYIACRALGALYLKFYNDPVLAKKYFEMSYRLNPNQPDVETLKMIIEGLQNAR
jgi:tetratricopeptide (TPR) repeat protein